MKILYGVGINDLPRGVSSNSKSLKVYNDWRGILRRCYDKPTQERNPSYIGCTISDEWKSLSNFKKWHDDNYIDGYFIDKDFISVGNKIYGKETCAFVPRVINNFITDRSSCRGGLPIGVTVDEHGYYKARCNNPFTSSEVYLGYFDCPHKATTA